MTSVPRIVSQPSAPAEDSLRRRLTPSIPPSWDRASSGSAEVAIDGVIRFLDRLVELPLPAWLAIGQGLMADSADHAVRQDAWADVESAIARHQLGPAAWRVRDALETAAFLVSRRAPQWTRATRCQFAATQGATHAAALALLTRAHIALESVRVLCAPFAPFIDRLLG